MLVFKDTILGFVAGIQLSANDMLRPGDIFTVAFAEPLNNVTVGGLTVILYTAHLGSRQVTDESDLTRRTGRQYGRCFGPQKGKRFSEFRPQPHLVR